MANELEPIVEAQIAMMDDDPGAYGPEAMAALFTKSAAISLKRIADTLDSVTDHAFDKPSIRIRED